MSCGSGCGCEICGNPPCAGGGGAALCAVAPTTAQAGAAGAVGVSAEASPCDHGHAFPTAIPVTATGIANLLGAAVTFAHSDHVHRIELEVEQGGVLVGSRPRVNFPNAAGNIAFTVTDVPGSDEVQIEANGLALGAVLPSTMVAGSAGAVGVSPLAAPLDHDHPVPVAAPVTATGVTNSAGVAGTFSRSDHLHRIQVEWEQASALVSSRPRCNFTNAAGNVVFTLTDVPGSDEVQITANVAGLSVYNARAQLIVTGGSWGIGSGSWNEIGGAGGGQITIPGTVSPKTFHLVMNVDAEAAANNTFQIRLTKNGVQIAGTVRTLFAGVAHAEWWSATIIIDEPCNVGDVIRMEVRRTAGAGVCTFYERVLKGHAIDR